MSDPVDVSGELNPNDAPGLISLIKGRQKEAEDGREILEASMIVLHSTHLQKNLKFL